MNSLKTAFVCLILLGVLYGMYQVLNAPPARFDDLGFAEPSTPTAEDGERIEAPEPMENRFAESSDAPPLAATGNDGVESESPSLASRETLAPPSARESGDETAPSGFGASPRSGSFAATNPASSSSPSPSLTPSTVVGSAPALTSSEPRASLSSNPSSGSFQPSPSSSPGLPASAPSNSIRQVNLDEARPSGFSPGGLPSSPPTSALPARSPRRSSISSVSDADFETRLAGAWTLANDLVEQGDYVGTLRELTFFYADPRLNSEQEQTLLAWLDALAAKVIYSTEAHLEATYIVRTGDDLGKIADGFGVTREFLFNVNQAKLPSADAPPSVGTELKVVRGPFHGEMSPSLGRLTMFLGDCYAGRFVVRSFQGFRDQTSVSVTRRYSNGMDFQGPIGVVPALHPDNPLGRYVVEFTGGVLMHEGVSGTPAAAQDLSFSGPDALDLHALFGNGSILSVTR